MHRLTSGELALTGSAITAVASAVVALAVSRTSRRRDHVARLWERRAEVYESVLCQADWWGELRADMARRVALDEVTAVTPPELRMALRRDDKYWHALRCTASGECEKRTSEADRQTCDLSPRMLPGSTPPT
jgi:hypothetical protein